MKEDAWIAIQSTLTATRVPVRIIGNVKGKKNWFYLLARRALSTANRHAGFQEVLPLHPGVPPPKSPICYKAPGAHPPSPKLTRRI